MSPQRGAEGARKREAREPGEMPREMPAIVVSVTMAVATWGAMYFGLEASQGAAELGDHRTPAALEAKPKGPSDDDGEAIFANRCAACHQANGMGLAGTFPPLGGSSWVVGDARRPVSIVLLGMQGPIEVSGKRYSSVMPAFGAQLDDAQVAAVLSYVRSSFGNDAPEVKPEVVEAQRAALGERGSLQGEVELETLVP